MPISVFPLAVQGYTTCKQRHMLRGIEGLNIEVICRPITSAVSGFFLCALQEFGYPEKSRRKTKFGPNVIMLKGNA